MAQPTSPPPCYELEDGRYLYFYPRNPKTGEGVVILWDPGTQTGITGTYSKLPGT